MHILLVSLFLFTYFLLTSGYMLLATYDLGLRLTTYNTLITPHQSSPLLTTTYFYHC